MDGARLSVLNVSPTATTYFRNRTDLQPSRECHIEAYDYSTVVNGPSTIENTVTRTSCGTIPAVSVTYKCPLTAPITTATCDVIVESVNGTSSIKVTLNESELGLEPATILEGLELLTASDAGVGTSTVSSRKSLPYFIVGFFF